MSNVAEVNRSRGLDWPSPDQLAAFSPVRNPGYPPQGRARAARKPLSGR